MKKEFSCAEDLVYFLLGILSSCDKHYKVEENERYKLELSEVKEEPHEGT